MKLACDSEDENHSDVKLGQRPRQSEVRRRQEFPGIELAESDQADPWKRSMDKDDICFQPGDKTARESSHEAPAQKRERN